MEIIGMRRLPAGSRVLLIALALGLVGALIFAGHVFAAPRAANQEECAAIADYALTSRALYAAGVTEEKRMAVLGAMYQFPDERISTIAGAVRKAASVSDLPPRDFAQRLMVVCIGGRGNMDAVLGAEI